MISANQVSSISRPQHDNPARPTIAARCELIDSRELAVRWRVPESWIREGVRRRTKDRIPHVRFGKYVRFEYGCPELDAWLTGHRCCKERGATSVLRPSTL
jgi:hypothetical protein